VRSLTTYPWSQRECHALVPRLGELLSTFVPGAGDSGEDLDQQFASGLWVALARIGGPAGPVLARAVGHRERLVREQVELPMSSLGQWGEATVAELGRLLEHPEAEVRASVVERLCYWLAAEEEGDRFERSVPPDVRAAIRKLEPAMRRAIATLDDPQRKELTRDLDEAIAAARSQ
jgi:hypothetical protein